MKVDEEIRTLKPEILLGVVITYNTGKIFQAIIFNRIRMAVYYKINKTIVVGVIII